MNYQVGTLISTPKVRLGVALRIFLGSRKKRLYTPAMLAPVHYKSKSFTYLFLYFYFIYLSIYLHITSVVRLFTHPVFKSLFEFCLPTGPRPDILGVRKATQPQEFNGTALIQAILWN